MEDEEELIVPNSPFWFEEEDDGKDSDVEILECRESLPKETALNSIPEPEPEPVISLIDSRKLFDDFYSKMRNESTPKTVTQVSTSTPVMTVVPIPVIRPAQPNGTSHSTTVPSVTVSIPVSVTAIGCPPRPIAPRNTPLPLILSKNPTTSTFMPFFVSNPPITSAFLAPNNGIIFRKTPAPTIKPQTSQPLATHFRSQLSTPISSNYLKSESILNVSPQTKLNLILQHQLNTSLASTSTSTSNGVPNKPHAVGLQRVPVISNCDKTTANLGNCVAVNRSCDKILIPRLAEVVAPVVKKPSFPCKCGKKFELSLDLEDHIKEKHMRDVKVNLRRLNETQVDDAVNGDSRFVDDAVQRADLKYLISFDHVFKPPKDKQTENSSISVSVAPKDDMVEESEMLIISIDNENNFDTTFVAASDFTVHVDCITRNIVGVYTGLDPLTVKMKFECYFCSVIYFRLKLLRKHAKEVHGVFFDPYINFYCAVCDEVMKYSMYRTHLRNNHSKVSTKSSQTPATFVCELCDEKFSTVQKLDSHRDSNHKASFQFHCVLCGVSFEKEFDLENHCLEHTCNQVFRCNICGEMFPEIAVFKNHIRSHEKNFKMNYVHCSVCDQLFRTKTDLDEHMLTMREADLSHYLCRGYFTHI